MPNPNRNQPLPEDLEIAQSFLAALKSLTDLMDRADKMGIGCGFSGIQKNSNGKFEAQAPFVNKRLL